MIQALEIIYHALYTQVQMSILTLQTIDCTECGILSY